MIVDHRFRSINFVSFAIFNMRQYLQYGPEELALLRICSKYLKNKPEEAKKSVKDKKQSLSQRQSFKQTKKFRVEEFKSYQDTLFQQRSTKKKNKGDLPGHIKTISQFIVEEESQYDRESNRREDSKQRVVGPTQTIKERIAGLKQSLEYRILRQESHRFDCKWVVKGRYIAKIRR